MTLATELRDEGVARAYEAARAAWQDAAARALYATMRRVGVGGTFTAEDVDWPEWREGRARAGVFGRACRAGFIVPAEYRPSSEPQSHARPKRAWRVVRL